MSPATWKISNIFTRNTQNQPVARTYAFNKAGHLELCSTPGAQRNIGSLVISQRISSEKSSQMIMWTSQEKGKGAKMHGKGVGEKKKIKGEALNPREQAAVRRCGLSLLNSKPYGRHLSWFWRWFLWPLFIAWQARTTQMRECLSYTCQCMAIGLMETNKHE